MRIISCENQRLATCAVVLGRATVVEKVAVLGLLIPIDIFVRLVPAFGGRQLSGRELLTSLSQLVTALVSVTKCVEVELVWSLRGSILWLGGLDLLYVYSGTEASVQRRGGSLRDSVRGGVDCLEGIAQSFLQT